MVAEQVRRNRRSKDTLVRVMKSLKSHRCRLVRQQKHDGEGLKTHRNPMLGSSTGDCCDAATGTLWMQICSRTDVKQNEIQYPRHLSHSVEKLYSFDGNDAEHPGQRVPLPDTGIHMSLVSTDFKKRDTSYVGTTTVKWVCEETYTAI